MGFTIKNFDDFFKETSPTSPKLLGETYQINCSSTHDDIPSFNVSPALFFALSMFLVTHYILFLRISLKTHKYIWGVSNISTDEIKYAYQGMPSMRESSKLNHLLQTTFPMIDLGS